MRWRKIREGDCSGRKKKKVIETHYGPKYVLLVLKLLCTVKLNQLNLYRGILSSKGVRKEQDLLLSLQNCSSIWIQPLPWSIDAKQCHYAGFLAVWQLNFKKFQKLVSGRILEFDQLFQCSPLFSEAVLVAIKTDTLNVFLAVIPPSTRMPRSFSLVFGVTFCKKTEVFIVW